MITFERYKQKYPDDIPDSFTQEEYDKMLEHNPYNTTWFGISDHRSFNNRYITGWIHGRYKGFNDIMVYIKRKMKPGWSIDKEGLRQLFAEITNSPDFGLKT